MSQIWANGTRLSLDKAIPWTASTSERSKNIPLYFQHWHETLWSWKHKILNFFNSRLKAIKKQMGHAVAETDAEEEALKDLNKDLLRRNEQIAQVFFFYFTHLFDIIWHWILFFYPCPKRSISKLLYFLNFRWSNYCLGNPDGILKPFWATLMSQFWIQKVEGSIEKFWG